jgi:hypothetical protein
LLASGGVQLESLIQVRAHLAPGFFERSFQGCAAPIPATTA